jgi:hypothetical protein
MALFSIWAPFTRRRTRSIHVRRKNDEKQSGENYLWMHAEKEKEKKQKTENKE